MSYGVMMVGRKAGVGEAQKPVRAALFPFTDEGFGHPVLQNLRRVQDLPTSEAGAIFEAAHMPLMAMASSAARVVMLTQPDGSPLTQAQAEAVTAAPIAEANRSYSYFVQDSKSILLQKTPEDRATWYANRIQNYTSVAEEIRLASLPLHAALVALTPWPAAAGRAAKQIRDLVEKVKVIETTIRDYGTEYRFQEALAAKLSQHHTLLGYLEKARGGLEKVLQGLARVGETSLEALDAAAEGLKNVAKTGQQAKSWAVFAAVGGLLLLFAAKGRS